MTYRGLIAGNLVRRLTDGILGAADGVLHLAGQPVGRALGLQLAVAGNLAGGLLDGADSLLGRAFDTVLVHEILLGEWGIGARKRAGTGIGSPCPGCNFFDPMAN